MWLPPCFDHLSCAGPAGSEVLQLEIESSFGELLCRVRTIPPPPDAVFFELTLSPIDSDTLKVIAICAHHRRYRRRGIPEALLPRVSELCRARLRSSSNRGENSNEWRTSESTRMWRRLVANGLASYDPVQDEFSLPPLP